MSQLGLFELAILCYLYGGLILDVAGKIFYL